MGPPKLIYCEICSVYLIKKRPFLELKFYYDIVYLTSPFLFFLFEIISVLNFSKSVLYLSGLSKPIVCLYHKQILDAILDATFT